MTAVATPVRRFAPNSSARDKSAAERTKAAKAAAEIIVDHAAMLLSESPDPLPSGIAWELQRACHEAKRPRFDSASDYVDYCEGCFKRGHVPFEPENIDQLKALNREFPEQCRKHFRMSPSELERAGLPKWFFDEIEPFGELWKEKFLKTVESDPVFGKACVVLFREAAQS